ncbi:MAG TPA: type II toxin-antitoxin system VapB family antitoxin [Terriglobales bacterium]|jgi:hypothetical protein
MRTNIDIDDALMRKAMRAAGTQTKKATVEAALQLLVRVRGQAAFLKSFGAGHIVETCAKSPRRAPPHSCASFTPEFKPRAGGSRGRRS